MNDRLSIHRIAEWLTAGEDDRQGAGRGWQVIAVSAALIGFAVRSYLTT